MSDQEVMIRGQAVPRERYRSVFWQSVEVARVDPHNRLGPLVAGHVAMGIRALPTLDAAIRSIIVLSKSADNLALIRELAESVIAFVEMPAPAIKVAEEEEEEETE